MTVRPNLDPVRAKVVALPSVYQWNISKSLMIYSGCARSNRLGHGNSRSASLPALIAATWRANSRLMEPMRRGTARAECGRLLGADRAADRHAERPDHREHGRRLAARGGLHGGYVGLKYRRLARRHGLDALQRADRYRTWVRSHLAICPATPIWDSPLLVGIDLRLTGGALKCCAEEQATYRSWPQAP